VKYPRPVAQEKQGIVFISDHPEGWPAEHPYEGHWEWCGPDGRLSHEEGPGWSDPEEAIKWGRELAPKVVVRIGTQHYSAGEVDLGDEAAPRWESR
jgi:hypothetical protein